MDADNTRRTWLFRAGAAALGLVVLAAPARGNSEETAPGLVAYWNTSARHAQSLGQIDWSRHDNVTVVETVNWPSTGEAFYAGGPTDYFAVRLLGRIDMPQDGTWTFYLSSDAGACLLIDGAMVVLDDANHSFRTTTGSVSLSAGEHEIEIRYLERNYSQGLVLEWSDATIERQVVPASALSHSVAGEEQASGEGGLRAYWINGARHAEVLGQVDWTTYDQTTVVSTVSWPISNEAMFPGGPTDYFALRLKGTIAIPTSGSWRFGLGSDAGARLFVDGELVVNDDANHSFRFASGTIDLDEGDHDIEVRYLERNYSHGLVLTWQGPGDALESVVPPEALTPGAVRPPGDTGGGGINAYWTTGARHASRLGQVDWDEYDLETAVPKLYWPIANGPFYTDGPTDYFATLFLAELNVPRGGSWRFNLGSDAGARLLIDGRLVVSDDANHSFRFRDGRVTLDMGLHELEVQYLERNYSQGLVLTWQGPGDPHEEVIPARAFDPQEFSQETLGTGLRAYWSDSVRHAERLGQVDWTKFDRVTVERDVSWEITNQALSDGGPTDYFALRMVGLIDIPETGRWTFGLGSDAGARLFIDGDVVVNDDANHSFRFRTGTVSLSAGTHPFEIRYLERNYSQGLVATWEGPGVIEEVIPARALSLDPNEPPIDEGGGGLRAYWIDGTRHAERLGEVDWHQYDTSNVVENVAWYIRNDPMRSDGQTDYFALRLVGTIAIPRDGEWTFGLGSDAGARVLIDGEPVVIDDANHSFRFREGAIELDEGDHEIEIHYLERNYSHGLVLTWRGPGDAFESVVPSSALTPAPLEVVGDGGYLPLNARWTHNQRHASVLSEVDWDSVDATTNEANISWRITSSPFYTGGPTDYFAASLTGRLIVPETGLWTFRIGSDAGASLSIGGEEVVVDDANHSFRFREGTIELEAGTHPLEVRYLERNYSQGLVLTWQGPSDPYERVIAPTDFEPAADTPVKVIRWREVSGYKGD